MTGKNPERGRRKKRNIPSEPVLKFLQTVFVEVTEKAMDYFGLGILAPFYRFESMRTLRLQSVTDYDRHGTPEIVERGSSQITHLELLKCSTSDGFSALIGPCANLKSFEYFHRKWSRR